MHDRKDYGDDVRILYFQKDCPKEKQQELLRKLSVDAEFQRQYRAFKNTMDAVHETEEESFHTPCERMDEAERYMEKRMNRVERQDYETHLVSCAHCRELVATYAFAMEADEEFEESYAADGKRQAFENAVKSFFGKALTFLDEPLKKLSPVAIRSASGQQEATVENLTYGLPGGDTVLIRKYIGTNEEKMVDVHCSNKDVPLFALNIEGDLCFSSVGGKSFRYIEECVIVVDNAYCITVIW
ncbi:hypothetical protein LJC27_07245 [Christensenellaceae bacterium OttesenSCG-928-M15]|nr:hypothetical protein [Christensenellaceae bacterium OttesenSCG-928-M15]